jgi:transposase-like protein
MPVLSHVHQLFNAEQCHAYIHTLRWKDRPRHCPRCQSHHIGRWGTYQYRPGCKRYWCHSCKRTFNDLTETLLHQSKRPLSYWILATFLLCLACSSQRIARERGVHIRTSYRWCWWLRNAALSSEMSRQLEDIVEADDLYPDFDTNRYILTGVRGRGALNCMASWISCLDTWPKILEAYMIQIDLKRPQLLLYFYV